jgi:hypothetical protein
MAKIPLPQRGQPLDVSYIYQLTSAINDLSTQVSTSVNNYSRVNDESKKTSDLKIQAKTIQVAINQSVNAGTEQTFTSTLDNFKNVPVVTATPVNEGGTVSGKDINVILTNITTSSVSGIVRFGSSGILSVNVNIVAVGLPN